MEGGLLQYTTYFKHSTAVHVARGTESSHSTVYCRVMLGKRTWTLHSSEQSMSELHQSCRHTQNQQKTQLFWFAIIFCSACADF